MPPQTAGTTRAPQPDPTLRPRGYLPLPGWGDPDSWLATLYAPLLPALKRAVTVRRWGRRGYDPRDVLVPRGYTVEHIAGGFTTPVHCCFDDEGACYVVECGHKVDARPRILKVDVRTGRYETFFELPDARWSTTGAVT